MEFGLFVPCGMMIAGRFAGIGELEYYKEEIEIMTLKRPKSLCAVRKECGLTPQSIGNFRREFYRMGCILLLRGITMDCF